FIIILMKNVLFLGLVFAIATVLKQTARLGRDSISYMQKFVTKLRGQEASFAVCVATALGLATAAELLGIHFAVGAFYGGILMTPQLLGREPFNRVRNATSAVTFGLFAPIFFAFVGLKFALVFEAWPLILAVTATAFVGKLLGGLMGGRVAGFRGSPLLALGVGLNARGMMELLLAQVGLATGIINATVLAAVRDERTQKKSLRGLRFGMALHVEAKTGVLALSLKEAGAQVRLASCNPLSSYDSVAAALAEVHGLDVYAKKWQTNEEYYASLNKVLDLKPDLVIDDGAALVFLLHTKRTDLLKGVRGGNEETTTGVIRLRAMERDGALRFPIIDVNDAQMKHFFDNRYGTG